MPRVADGDETAGSFGLGARCVFGGNQSALGIAADLGDLGFVEGDIGIPARNRPRNAHQRPEDGENCHAGENRENEPDHGRLLARSGSLWEAPISGSGNL